MTVELRASAVLLDMDGTLVDSTAVVERVWSDWARAHDLDPAHVLTVVHGRQGHESMAILLPDRSREENLAENQVLAARETADLDGVVAVPGADALLGALAELPHALVTSAPVPLAEARMSAAGLPIPALAVTAEAVSASKPDPEGFLAAAAELEADPVDCVVFEDSAAGIAAGLAAGMRVVGVGVGATAARHGAHWTVPDLSGVRVRAEGGGLVLTLSGVIDSSAPA